MAYPRMLYRKGGEEKIHGVDCDYRTVADESEEAAARAASFVDYEELFGTGPVTPRRETEAEAADLQKKVENLTAQLKEARSDLQAAADLLEEERAARATAESERDQANERVADMLAEQLASPAEPPGLAQPGRRKSAALTG